MSAAFAVRGPPLLLWAGQPGWQRLCVQQPAGAAQGFEQIGKGQGSLLMMGCTGL